MKIINTDESIYSLRTCFGAKELLARKSHVIWASEPYIPVWFLLQITSSSPSLNCSCQTHTPSNSLVPNFIF